MASRGDLSLDTMTFVNEDALNDRFELQAGIVAFCSLALVSGFAAWAFAPARLDKPAGGDLGKWGAPDRASRAG